MQSPSKNPTSGSVKTNLFPVIIGSIILIIFLIFLSPKSDKKTVDWQADYNSQRISAQISDEYTKSSSVLDVDNVRAYADQVLAVSNSPEDALKKTLLLVHSQTTYKPDVAISYCYAETASSVLLARQGDCVSMAKASAAILRAMGIAARTVGGCYDFAGCYAIMGTLPIDMPMSVIQDGKKRGGLHEWVEVWLPSKGWVIADPTINGVYSSCSSYIIESYDNANPIDICVIKDQVFAKECYGR